jgi:L-ascorbate metabolism protein UlaG (beta-lactamase superfamily)
MEITWLGHSSFLIKDSKGRTLITDPFDNTVGYETYKESADVVTISHHHFDHDYTKEIKGNPEIIDKVGFFYACDIPIKGIPSYHDKSKGAKRGENVIYIFKMDDYSLCHLGDLGHTLTNDDINAIGNVDILFIPVGGNFTVDGDEAAELAKSINSKIIIPMHYKTPALSFPIEGVEKFLTNMKNGEKIGSKTLKIEGKLEGINKVKILDYK